MLICSIRVNVVLVLLLLSIFIGFILIAASIFVESESLELIKEAFLLGGKGDSAADLLMGLNKAKLSLRLLTVSQPSNIAAN